MIKIDWKGDIAFQATAPDGTSFVMDGGSETGRPPQGVSPMEALLAAAGVCSAIDVIMILQKKRQQVSSYRIEVDGERPAKGTFPRPFTTMTVRHIVSGPKVDPAAVEQAVRLSDDKYCSVIATIRSAPKITSEWRIE